MTLKIFNLYLAIHTLSLYEKEAILLNDPNFNRVGAGGGEGQRFYRSSGGTYNIHLM